MLLNQIGMDGEEAVCVDRGSKSEASGLAFGHADIDQNVSWLFTNQSRVASDGNDDRTFQALIVSVALDDNGGADLRAGTVAVGKTKKDHITAFHLHSGVPRHSSGDFQSSGEKSAINPAIS